MFSVSLARSERPSYLRSFSFVLLLAALVPILMPSRVLAVDIGGSTFSADTTLTSGDTWTVGNVTINGGVTVTVPGAATVMMNSGANVNLSGLGTLAIDATGLFQHATTTSGDNIVVTDAGSILNNGTYEFTTGGDIQLKGSGSTFYNNGLLTKTGINASSNDPSHIFPNSTSSGGTFINTGDITVTAGHLNIAGGSSTGGNFTTTSGAMLSFSGRWSELTGVADNSAGGFIGTSAQDPAGTTGARFEAAAATTVLNVTGTGLVLGTGAVDVHGNVLQNQGLLVIGSSQNPEIVDLFGGGTFVNASGGTVLLDKGSLTLTATGLTNEGTLTLNDGETGVTDIVTINGPNAITNVTGGVVNLEDGNLVLNTALTNEGTMVLNAGTTSTTRVLISGTTPLTNSAT
ncbi:MAG: hypothetical protein KDK99_06375, partial [Verrucomicrobiales bacterium]|nr:hypothetical protein [Verrucomicrobiales bacterium]